MKKYLILFLWAFMIPAFICGQIRFVPYGSVEVYNGEELLQNPWAGGLNSPQFSTIDMNNDGKKDLVAFERNFYGYQKVFLNYGQAGEINYKHAPEYQSAFPHMRNWMLLRDYNCDGREDIFTSVPGGIAVYRNDLTPAAGMKFSLVTPILFTLGINGIEPLYVAPPDIPAITDVDNDGDLDILAFNIIGSTLEYHKNLSVENSANCDELDFELRNACWGYFSEDGNNNTVTLFDTCDVNVGNPESSGRHAGSTVLAIDLNGNGVKDLLLGDITYNNLVQLTNGGTTTAAIMVDQSTTFPGNTTAVNLTVFPAAYFIDVDNDNHRDLLVAPNNPNTSENYNNIWLYSNIGSDEDPEFVFSRTDFLQSGMIDLGEGSFPAFFDADGNGLKDIVAGSKGYFAGAGEYESRLLLLTNVGTAEEPAFEIASDDYAGLSVYDFNGIYPTFADIDNDGDEDMLIGDEDGRLHLFTNKAGPGNQAMLELTHPNYFSIDAGESAKPHLTDVNSDGLPDILVGERSGTVLYFENTGTADNAFFTATPTIEKFGNIDVMPPCCTGFSAPHMTVDSLGNKILYVGSEQGYLYLYDNIDGNLAGSFNLHDSLYLFGAEVNISGADINLDGKKEFVYGEFAGGLGLLKEGIPPVFNLPDNVVTEWQIRVYPNPVAEHLNIECPGEIEFEHAWISVHDIYGRKLFRKQINDKTSIVDVSPFKRGIYILSVEGRSFKSIKRFIKL